MKASSFRDFTASTTNVTNKYDTVIITRAIKIDINKNAIMKKVSCEIASLLGGRKVPRCVLGMGFEPMIST